MQKKKCVTGCSTRTYREDILLLLNCIAETCGNTTSAEYSLSEETDCCGSRVSLLKDGVPVEGSFFDIQERGAIEQIAPIIPLPTQAVVPVTFDSGTYVLAQADLDSKLAEFLVTTPNIDEPRLLVLNQGFYCPDEPHGLNIGEWYYLSPTAPGELVAASDMVPGEGIMQRVLFVVSETCVYLQLDQSIASATPVCISVEPGNVLELDEDGCLYVPTGSVTCEAVNACIDCDVVNDCLSAEAVNALIECEVVNGCVGAAMDAARGLSYDDGTNQFSVAISATGGNSATLDATGILVSQEAVQDAVGAGFDPSNGLSYDDPGDGFAVAISAVAGNQITIETDGIYAPDNSSNSSLYIDVTQVTHGFGSLDVPFPVYYDNDLNQFALAQADSLDTAADNLCIDATDPDVLRLQNQGKLELTAHGYDQGVWYVTDPDNPGIAIPKDLLAIGDTVQYLFFVDDADNLMLQVLPADGIDCEVFNDCVGSAMSASRGLSYDDVVDEFSVAVSADAGNQVTINADGINVPVGAIDPSLGFYLYDDFPSGVYVSGGIGTLGWASSVSGLSAAISGFVISNNNPGVVRINKGSDSNGRAAIYLDETFIFFGGGEVVYETLVQIPSPPDGSNSYVARIGFGDTPAADQVDGVYFECSQADTHWIIKTANNSVRTAVTTTALVIAGMNKLRIEINAAGTSVEYFLGGVSIGTISTNIPTTSARSTGLIYQIISTVGSATRSILPDYMKVSQVFSTPR